MNQVGRGEADGAWRAGLRRRLHDVLIDDSDCDPIGRRYNNLMAILIVVSVAAVALETVTSIRAGFGLELEAIDTITVLLISLDYLLRLWAVPENGAYADRSPAVARLHYMCTPFAVFDLLSVLPFYAHLIGSTDLRVLLLLRLLRAVRLAQHMPALGAVMAVIAVERRSLLAAMALMLVGITFSAGIMYQIERTAQPEAFGSIPDAMWWAVVTMATVGYGDVVPTTTLGKIMGSVIIITGSILAALPAGIVASGFITEMRKRDFMVSWKLVARVPLFAGLDAAEVGAVAELLRPEVVPARYTLMRRGEMGDRMYFLVDGKVEVELPSGPIQLGVGDFIGEMSLVKKGPRSATVVTLTECRLFFLDAAAFNALGHTHPRILASIVDVAKQREAGEPD